MNRIYRNEINRAWDNRIPIVASDSHAGNNALGTASWYYLDTVKYMHADAPVASSVLLQDESGFTVKSLNGRIPEKGGTVLAVIRSPFRVCSISSDLLSELEGERFPVY